MEIYRHGSNPSKRSEWRYGVAGGQLLLGVSCMTDSFVLGLGRQTLTGTFSLFSLLVSQPTRVVLSQVSMQRNEHNVRKETQRYLAYIVCSVNT